MTKIKYYYDKETFTYKPVNRSKNLILKPFLFILGMAIFGLIGIFILSKTNILITQKELIQKRELDNYKLQLQLLNSRMIQVQEVMSNLEERDNNLYRSYFNANAIPEEQRKAGFGGINRYKSLEGFNNSNLIINTTKRLDILTNQIAIQSKSLDGIEKLAVEKENLLKSIPSIQPIKKSDLKRIASGFGWRIDPFLKVHKKHQGMDFSAKTGTPVYATGDGFIKRADNRSDGYGRHIRINHGYGYSTLYAHLSDYNVKVGQAVKRGDIIGFVGNTGRSVAPHLHYEIHKNKKKINPINFYYGNLSAEEFQALVDLANIETLSLD